MSKKFSVSVSKKIKKFNKKIEIPGDKSCSIRAILFASQCIGVSKIKNLLESEDVPGVNVIEFAYKTFAASDFCEHLTLTILGLTLLLGKIM